MRIPKGFHVYRNPSWWCNDPEGVEQICLFQKSRNWELSIIRPLRGRAVIVIRCYKHGMPSASVICVGKEVPTKQKRLWTSFWICQVSLSKLNASGRKSWRHKEDPILKYFETGYTEIHGGSRSSTEIEKWMCCIYLDTGILISTCSEMKRRS